MVSDREEAGGVAVIGVAADGETPVLGDRDPVLRAGEAGRPSPKGDMMYLLCLFFNRLYLCI